MSKKKRIALIIITGVVLLSVLLHYTLFDCVYHSDYRYVQFAGIEEDYIEHMDKKYVKSKKAELLSELGDYEKCSFNVHKKIEAIFVSFSTVTVASYTDKNYNAQKKKMLKGYKFFNESDEDLWDYLKDSMEIGEDTPFEFSIKNWQFKMIKEEGTYVPEDFRLFAFNDDDKKLALLSFHDQDLDCFGDENNDDEMVSFIKDHFKYNFKR